MTAQTTTSSISSPSTTQNTSSSGLNDAGRIGVGVGVPLGVLFLTIIAVLAWMLRRRTRSLREEGKNHAPAGFGIKGDPTQRPFGVKTGINENTRHVLEQDPPMHELHGIAQSPHLRELQGSPATHRRELP